MALPSINRQTRLAIDMGQHLVRAVEAELRGSRVVVRRSVTVEAPSTLDTEDPRATGVWLAEALQAAGMRARRAVFAVNREGTSHKRLLLATTHAEDLPDMTRLAMQRELGPAAEGAVIDFIPGGREEAGTIVQALAAPQREIDYIRALAQHAGLTVDRISLRTFGSALLLETLAEPPPSDAMQLAVDLTGEGLELCFVAGGEVRHSRGAEVKYQRDVIAAADAAITEVRRSWAAWRLAQPDISIARAAILGERELARRVVDGVVDLVGDASIIASHPRIGGDVVALEACWPLVGMLLEDALRRPRINLGSPRRAPDLAARRRMGIYAAVGSVVLSLLVGWTIGARELRALSNRATELRSKAEGAQPESQRFKRDFFRAQHLAAWEEAAPRWLDAVVDVGGFAPDPSRVVFDLLVGTLEPGSPKLVKEAGKESRIALRRPMRILLEGEARERAAVDALREAFLKDQRFSLDSPGTDKTGGKRLAMPFTFILRPGGAPLSAAPGGVAGAAGAKSAAGAAGANDAAGNAGTKDASGASGGSGGTEAGSTTGALRTRDGGSMHAASVDESTRRSERSLA